MYDQSVRPSFPSRHRNVLFYSNQCRQNLRTLYVRAIESAHYSIDLAIFDLEDPLISRALIRQSQRSIPTHIFYDARNPLSAELLRRTSAHPIHLKGLMHQKILVADHKRIFIGSANMTPSSLTMHDNLVVGIYDPPLAAFLEQALHAKGGKFPHFFHTRVGKQNIDLALLPDLSGETLQRLITAIDDARHSIHIALFTLTHPDLCSALIRAHQRGVAVTVVIDLHTGLGASARALEILNNAGIPLFASQGLQLLHHKFAWIDRKKLLFGSANWTRAAFEKNDDCLVTIAPLTKEQRHFMDHLWRRISIESTKYRPQQKQVPSALFSGETCGHRGADS